MPRYYFNLRSYSDADDAQGVELVDEAAARELAVESARELVYADIANGWLNLDHRIEVVDEAGDPVLTMVFRDAFTTTR
jgi:hypothetical protein